MKIKLESLQHQKDALGAIDKYFQGIDELHNDPDANYIYANPLIKGRYRDKTNIDIKMETGTGKTYVYTRMMYDLHQKYGLFKFVIVVPSPSIKEGTRSFITSRYAKQHFSQFYPNVRIQLNVINNGDFNAKAGRRNFPAQLSEFVEGTRQNVNQIEVLLINAGMLHSKSMSRNDYDQTLLGGESSPNKAIRATRPIVIIDEPHRFSQGNKYYDDIVGLKPQMIVRFGATFPQKTIGKGKNKKTITDYYRGKPQYNLNAIDSFNQGLVKAVDIFYPEISREQAANLYRVKSAKQKELILSKNGHDFSVGRNELLSEIDQDFTGNLSYVGGKNKELSNALELNNGMKLIPGTFSESYQDRIIRKAIDQHFIAEQENFLRPENNYNSPKVKTLSLFFIDSIRSFRGNKRQTKGWLAEHFEKILTDKLGELINKYRQSDSQRECEYLKFLQATQKSLKSEHQDVYAGYFSEDRGTSDADIQAQIDDILNNKEKLLSFKDEHGNWLTRRFLFSKWTLREGWDNPNVFVIAKLRSSGSENSKIQEVGRGLRLPVDETGHRLKQDEFSSRLSFLIGYDEKEFAQELVNQINDDTPVVLDHTKLTEEMISAIVSQQQKVDRKFDEQQLVNDLGSKGIIDFDHHFKREVVFDGQKTTGFEALLQCYPNINHDVVANDRIIDRTIHKVSTKVKLQKRNWKKLKNVWQALSKRQMVVYGDGTNDVAEKIAREIFNNKENFVFQKTQSINQKIKIGNQAEIHQTTETGTTRLTMDYGKFLQQINFQTGLSINLLNNLMVTTMRHQLGNNSDYINEATLEKIVKNFVKKFEGKLIENYEYQPLNFESSTSVYNSDSEEFLDYVSANKIGSYGDDKVDGDPKYLYERPPVRYDSVDPELEILKHDYDDDVVVYGKLPKEAIKIPRFNHGTTTPDFIFMINRHGEKSYLIVETKAENMRIGDQQIQKIQKKYFDKLTNSGIYYQFTTNYQDIWNKIDELADK